MGLDAVRKSTSIWIGLVLITAAGPVFGAMDRATIEAGLKSRDRALHIKDGWIRDPYIILGPDEVQQFEKVDVK